MFESRPTDRTCHHRLSIRAESAATQSGGVRVSWCRSLPETGSQTNPRESSTDAIPNCCELVEAPARFIVGVPILRAWPQLTQNVSAVLNSVNSLSTSTRIAAHSSSECSAVANYVENFSTSTRIAPHKTPACKRCAQFYENLSMSTRIATHRFPECKRFLFVCNPLRKVNLPPVHSASMSAPTKTD